MSGVGDVSGTRVSVCGRGGHKCADEKRSFIVCNPAGMSGIVESEDCISPPSQAEACGVWTRTVLRRCARSKRKSLQISDGLKSASLHFLLDFWHSSGQQSNRYKL